MIELLRKKIDIVINDNPEPNKWRIYSQAKREIQDYETVNDVYFNHEDWMKYIDYITDRLQI